MLVLGTMFVGGFVLVLYGLVGAVRTFQGRPFRYLLIGDRVEQFMRSR